MVDGAGSLFGPILALADSGVWREGRQSNLLDGGAPFYRTYRTEDDRFMAVGALEPAFYSAFVSGLGLDETELPDRFDPGNWDELADRFALVFATRTRAGWQDVFDDTDGCVTPVLAMSEVMDHTHNAERGAIVTSDGGQRPAPAPRFGSWSPSTSGDTTGRGALQAATILMERGFSRDDVHRLMEAGIIADA
jgi:alpha-methylacyl-CoA racemase